MLHLDPARMKVCKRLQPARFSWSGLCWWKRIRHSFREIRKMRRLNIRKAITVAVLLIGAVGLGEALEGSYVPVGISDGRLVVEEVLSGKRMCIVNDLWVPMADAPVEVEGKAGQLISLASDGLSVGSGADQRSVSAIGAPGFDPGRVGHAAVDVCRRPWPGRAGLGVDFLEEQTPGPWSRLPPHELQRDGDGERRGRWRKAPLGIGHLRRNPCPRLRLGPPSCTRHGKSSPRSGPPQVFRPFTEGHGCRGGATTPSPAARAGFRSRQCCLRSGRCLPAPTVRPRQCRRRFSGRADPSARRPRARSTPVCAGDQFSPRYAGDCS